MTVPDRQHILDQLASLVRTEGRNLRLDRAAALVAVHEQPWLDPKAPLEALDALAAGLRIPEGADVFEATARMNQHLFVELGFAGDTDDYHAPHNSYLDRVLERRRGLPILLSLVYIEVARRAGVAMEGIGFPGHFLVAPKDDGRFFIDPFAGGAVRRREEMMTRLEQIAGAPRARIVDPDKYLAPIDGPRFLARINQNLKSAFLQNGDMEGALRAVERLLILTPQRRQHARDRAVLLGKLGRWDEAANGLRTYLDEGLEIDDREQLQELLEHFEEQT